MKIATLLKSSTVLSMVALLALSACGGGGGEGPMTGGGQMVPEDVDLSSVTAGYMAGAGTVQMAAGQSVVHGDVEFTCAAGDADCAVTVEVGADGTVTATSAGGMVTAMNSAAYNTRITPMAVDLAPVTAGFMAQAGTVTITAGQSAIHGDVEFTCAAGGDDCGVTVEVGADGTVSATSTGGMVTAMNSDAYNTRITPMAVNLSPVTAGFMAGAGTIQVAAGQSVNHGDVEFTCAAGSRDCEVMVMVNVHGAITATSTGGTVTAMNADAYNTRISVRNQANSIHAATGIDLVRDNDPLKTNLVFPFGTGTNQVGVSQSNGSGWRLVRPIPWINRLGEVNFSVTLDSGMSAAELDPLAWLGRFIDTTYTEDTNHGLGNDWRAFEVRREYAGNGTWTINIATDAHEPLMHMAPVRSTCCR